MNGCTSSLSKRTSGENVTTQDTSISANNQELVQTDSGDVQVTNEALPEWSLWAMGFGIFCFALIIPSPFKFKGF